MTPEEITAFLQAVAARPAQPTVEAVQSALAAWKRAALGDGDQEMAKNIWWLEQALKVQEHYLAAFRLLQERAFYKAWCELERVEVSLIVLERHKTRYWEDFRCDLIQEYTAKWQRLFPYKYFFSPEFIQVEKICSICKQPVRPRSFCGHRAGEIYNGEECLRIVTKLGAIGGIAIVDKPVQKYSVMFLRDEKDGTLDQYNYCLVEYAINALRAPFDGWEVGRTTRREPHEHFADLGKNDPCPCNSGKNYEDCCLHESGVLWPHWEFTFSVEPPDGVLKDVFIRGAS